MKSILDQPRTVTMRGTAMLFSDFADLAAFANRRVQTLKDQEARLGSALSTPAEWAALAERAEGLADLCTAQEQWLAEHNAELAAEADAIREAIRQLDPVDPKTTSSEGT